MRDPRENGGIWARQFMVTQKRPLLIVRQLGRNVSTPEPENTLAHLSTKIMTTELELDIYGVVERPSHIDLCYYAEAQPLKRIRNSCLTTVWISGPINASLLGSRWAYHKDRGGPAAQAGIP